MHESIDARVAREDLALFLTAGLVSTGQDEFYASAAAQDVGMTFLHDYVRGNYRRLYALTLAAPTTDHTRARVVVELLAAGAPADPDDKAIEGALIAATLRDLPPPRAYGLIEALQRRRVNNRRARAVIREYLASRPADFDAVKYRRGVKAAARHAHLDFDDERGAFLFEGAEARRFETPLFERWRQAHYSAKALFELPMSVAEGFAAKLGLAPEKLLAGFRDRMTKRERERTVARRAWAGLAVDDAELASMSLTRLCLYVLSRDREERAASSARFEALLRAAAARVRPVSPLGDLRVAAVLDRSRSSVGSRQKRRRPLAVALGVHLLLEAHAKAYAPFWTAATKELARLEPRGATDLARPLIDALRTAPDLVVIVSDGFENDPLGGAGEVARLFRAHVDPDRRTTLVHVAPALDAARLGPRALGDAIPTIGIRDAEDLFGVLPMARFVDGGVGLDALEADLRRWAAAFLRRRGLAVPAALEAP